MGQVLPLFSVAAGHEFFTDGRCRALEFSPTRESVSQAKNIGLLLKSTLGGFAAFYDEDRVEALRLSLADADEPLRFVFRVTANDPLFANYTESGAPREHHMLYFDNLRATDDGSVQWPPDGPLIEFGEVVSDDNFVAFKDEGFDDLPQAEREGAERLRQAITKGDLLGGDITKRDLLDNVITKRDRLVRPVAFVCIWITDALLEHDDGVPSAREYKLNFAARQTWWKYYLFGAIADGTAVIVDLDSETTFSFFGEEVLPGDRRAMTFLADKAIPLRDRTDRRFQLRLDGKVLVRRLPAASADKVARRSSGEDELVSKDENQAIIYVSDIYVNG